MAARATKPRDIEIAPLLSNTVVAARTSRYLIPAILITVIALSAAIVWLVFLGNRSSGDPTTTYDVIVVGVGTAGSVLVARLSENPKVKVLALEGGGSSLACNGGPTFLTCYAGTECLDGPGAQYSVFDVPLFHGLTHNSFLNWTWSGRYPKSVGRVLGGSAAHNDFVWLRGHPNDFTAMTQAGLKGWDWNTVLEYYKRSEVFVGSFANDTNHGTTGPITVTDAQGNPNFRVLQDSASKLGYAVNIDINSPNRSGFGFMQSSLRQGRRSCSGGEMLCPALHRGNVELRRYADVSEVLFKMEGGNPVAEGVRYRTPEGETVEVRGARAVVLAAGNWGSPYILLRSGVGPRSELEGLGLAVVKDVPGVGKNIRDEVVTQMAFEYLQPDNPPRHALQSSGELYEWLTEGTGGSMMTTEGGFIHRENHSNLFDLHVRFFNDDPDANIYLAPNSWAYCNITLSPDLKRVLRTCANVPEDDIEELAYGIEEVRKIIAQEPMKSYQKEISPGPNVSTRAELKAWLSSRVGDYNHGQGSLRMGVETDPTAVLDETFKVRGIAGLWVADNSVFPVKIAHDAMAAATMAGERGADFLKQHFN